MSGIQRNETGKPLLVLPPVLDLAAAPELKTALQAALQAGEGLEIDGASTDRVSSLCLQLLASAARSFAQTGGPGLVFRAWSDRLAETATVLALGDTLGINGVNNG